MKTKTDTLQINERVFVANDAAMMETLFQGGATASGYFKQYKRGIEFRDMQGEPFAFLCANSPSSPFWVRAYKTSAGKTRYSYEFSSMDAARLGLDVMQPAAAREKARQVWEDANA